MAEGRYGQSLCDEVPRPMKHREACERPAQSTLVVDPGGAGLDAFVGEFDAVIDQEIAERLTSAPTIKMAQRDAVGYVGFG